MPAAKSFDHVTIAKWFFLLLFFGTAMLFWKVLAPFATVLITAAIVAVVVTPVERHIRAFVGHPRISAAIMLLVVFCMMVLPLMTVTLLAAREALQLVQGTVSNPTWLADLATYLAPVTRTLPDIVVAQFAQIDPSALVRTVASWIGQNLTSAFAGTADLLLKTFIFFVALYFFLVDREKIHEEILLLSPLRHSIDENITRRLVETVRGVVFGSVIISLVQGVIAAIGFSIFGVPAPFIWAGFVVVAAQVPTLGTSLVMLPAVAYLAITGHAPQSIGLLIWAMVAVGLIDNVIQPFVVGNKTRMHALLILLSMLGGLNAFGPIGFIFGPTIFAAFLVMVELYRSGILEKNRV